MSNKKILIISSYLVLIISLVALGYTHNNTTRHQASIIYTDKVNAASNAEANKLESVTNVGVTPAPTATPSPTSTAVPTIIPTQTPTPTAIPTVIATPKPIQAPKPVAKKDPVKAAMSKDQIKNRICEVFGNHCKDALIIAEKESGFNTNAKSSTNDHGIFQINVYWQRDKYKDINELYDPETNIQIAYKIFKGRGNSWSAWATCKYLPKCY